MQSTDLEAQTSIVLQAARRMELVLIIGNKNYSSWSMRPWVTMKAFGIPFKEVRILLDQADTVTNIAEYSPAGRVPVLLDGTTTIWDSLAICEYLAEQFVSEELWPSSVSARAVARSICAEMHTSFSALRRGMPMDIRANGAEYASAARSPEVQADIGRITEIWEDCLRQYGHHRFLFGDFSIADAYFAPVVMRFRSYGVFLAPALQAYMDRVVAHPAVESWIQEALAETEVLPRYTAP